MKRFLLWALVVYLILLELGLLIVYASFHKQFYGQVSILVIVLVGLGIVTVIAKEVLKMTLKTRIIVNLLLASILGGFFSYSSEKIFFDNVKATESQLDQN